MPRQQQQVKSEGLSYLHPISSTTMTTRFASAALVAASLLLLLLLLPPPCLSLPLSEPQCQSVLKSWLDGLSSVSPSSASLSLRWSDVESELRRGGCEYKDLWVELWTVDQRQAEKKGRPDEHREEDYFQK